jgi:wobble nucleotide-excising tRNase
VIDDPVSSLDSDVLFMVSALIKKLIDEAEAGTGQIKQIFILTHNIYFHKEVSFTRRRQPDRCMAHETFWVVKKRGDKTSLVPFPTNPIKTSYELLWDDVRNAHQSKTTIQNTLRRILENYFKILGGMDFERIEDKFEGRDKIIYGSLISWLHDGSHSLGDDLHLSTDDNVIDQYLAVFKRIFEVTGHQGHYDMMAGTWDATEAANQNERPGAPDLVA